MLIMMAENYDATSIYEGMFLLSKDDDYHTYISNDWTNTTSHQFASELHRNVNYSSSEYYNNDCGPFPSDFRCELPDKYFGCSGSNHCDDLPSCSDHY